MNNADWKLFFAIGAEVLGKGSRNRAETQSWCSWTTFDRFTRDCGYWTAGFLNATDLNDTFVNEGSPWSQYFLYEQIAHIILPSRFYWEGIVEGRFQLGHREQNIKLFSEKLTEAGIPHRLTDLVLEIKLY